MVDEMGRAATNLHKIAHAITPTDAAPLHTHDGGYVASLTEAVVFAANNLGKIAEAISHLADAVRDHGESVKDGLDASK
jgi:phage-related minor tail protein